MKGLSKRWLLPGLLALLPLAACGTPTGTITSTGTSTSAKPQPTVPFDPTQRQIGYTPKELRDAYGVTSLINQGYTGKGVTVAVIESYGSPTLQQDVDKFDQRYGLPDLHVQVVSPLGTVAFDPNNSEMTGWESETTLDVEIIHAIAPDAQVVVMTSPVDETEGVQGLPEFLKLEQDVVNNHRATIISQSFGASEYTLKDAAGQQEIQAWDQFYQQATTQDGITFFASSGDNGATDLASDNIDQRPLVPSRTIGFPADDPWVTAVGGTTIWPNGNGQYNEIVWGGKNDPMSGSEGGFSAFFPEPSYQKSLPASFQSEDNGKRGIPDVSAAADPATGLACYDGNDGWFVAGGTSASSPLWAGIAAIAQQKAGHSLGFLNSAIYKLGQSSSYAQDFRDITVGNNTTYTQDGQVFVQGFNATSGWDAATGWGSPRTATFIPALINALK